MATQNRPWFRMRITSEQRAQIEELARRRGTTPEAAVLALIEEAVQQPTQATSFLDGIEHLVGSCEGPEDLSTNPDYMEDYGR